MSVLVEFAMFPTDKQGESASPYVSKVLKIVKASGWKYKLSAMGTTFETDTINQANKLIEDAYLALEPFSNRVYTTIKMDIRKNAENRIEGKIESIKKHIGDINT